MAHPDAELTRKERRERARVQRQELERTHAAAAARRRRMIQLGGVLAAAVVVIVVIIAASGGGSSTPTKVQPGQAVPGAAQAQALFAGIPEQGRRLGDPKAPVTLAEYVDLQCPVCRDYSLTTFPSLVTQYVKTGKVQIELHSDPVIDGPDGTTAQSQAAARFAFAVGQQDLLWPFAELMYENQQQEGTGYLTSSYLQTIASGISGLNVSAASAGANSAAVTQQVTTDNAFARANRITGTPTFYVGPTGGRLTKLASGALPLSDFASVFATLGVK